MNTKEKRTVRKWKTFRLIISGRAHLISKLKILRFLTCQINRLVDRLSWSIHQVRPVDHLVDLLIYPLSLLINRSPWWPTDFDWQLVRTAPSNDDAVTLLRPWAEDKLIRFYMGFHEIMSRSSKKSHKPFNLFTSELKSIWAVFMRSKHNFELWLTIRAHNSDRTIFQGAHRSYVLSAEDFAWWELWVTRKEKAR